MEGKNNNWEQIQQTIAQGIKKLGAAQGPDGNFLSLTTSDPRDFSAGTTCHTVFSSAIILQSLSQLSCYPGAITIGSKIARFLISQKSSSWSFNYWVRQSEWAAKMPYPDDLDDTACAIAALKLFNCHLVTGEALAKFTILLTMLEVKTGGPYTTWLVPKATSKVWRDTDLAVNANIGYLLSLYDISLPNLNSYFGKAIEQQKIHSPYYASSCPIIYFLSRFYNGAQKQRLADITIEKWLKNNGRKRNPLDTALAIISLINLGFPTSKLSRPINYLVDSYSQWHAYPFYTGINPNADNKNYFAGSDALTTAFCLEALQRYLELNAKHIIDRQNRKRHMEYSRRYRAITSLAVKRIPSLSPELKGALEIYMSKIFSFDTDKQVLLIPYYLTECLGSKTKVNDRLLAELGLANLFGWIAHTIYDDLLDGDATVEKLPAANTALRISATMFQQALPGDTSLEKLIEKTFDRMDAANGWEICRCRFDPAAPLKSIAIPDFGNYSILADRSFGHALSPLIVLFSLGRNQQSKDFKYLSSFFKHYIIARQMSDDAHDWEKDLLRGQINSAGAQVLTEAKKIADLVNEPIKNNLDKLKAIFWQIVIAPYCQKALLHLSNAEKSLAAMSIVENFDPLIGLMVPVRNSLKKAADDSKAMAEFLHYY